MAKKKWKSENVDSATYRSDEFRMVDVINVNAKALKNALDRIDTLEAKVKSLENKVFNYD